MKCVYPTPRGTCTLTGKGDPSLCGRHERYRDEFEENGIGEALEVLFQRPEVQGVLHRINGILDGVGGILEGKRTVPTPKTTTLHPKSLEDPRTIMGFGVQVKLTVDLIKDRRKALARLYHPDQGGSTEAMQRINTAADALLAQLKK